MAILNHVFNVSAALQGRQSRRHHRHHLPPTGGSTSTTPALAAAPYVLRDQVNKMEIMEAALSVLQTRTMTVRQVCVSRVLRARIHVTRLEKLRCCIEGHLRAPQSVLMARVL